MIGGGEGVGKLGFRYVVVADDLTGANDTGVQFTRYGYRSYIIIDPSNLDDKVSRLRNRAHVLVINTESRADPPTVAYRKCKRVAETLKREKIDVIYKKVDSTLRGNIGAELDGVLDGFGRELAFFTSAFPLNNRIIIGGYLLVNGLPLDLTPFSRDPVSPVKEANVLSIIRKQSRRRVSHIGYEYVAQGFSRIRERIEEIRKTADIIVFDAVSQDNLRNIALAVKDYYTEAVYSGSAGLARELPKAWGEEEKINGIKILPKGSFVVCLCGSVNPLTLKQIEHAVRTIDSMIIDVDGVKVLRDKQKTLSETLHKIKKAVEDGKRCIIIRTAKSYKDVERTQRTGKKMGLDKRGVAKSVAEFLGIVGEKIIYEYREELSGLIITGGDTAINACKKISVQALEVHGEIDPGVPLTQGISQKIGDIRLVTKAGGFGREDTITKAVKILLGLF